MQDKKKIKILEFGTTDTKGGAAAVSWALKQGLEKRGHTVNMVVGYKRSRDPSVREIWDAPVNNFISKIIKRNFRARLHHRLAYWFSNDIAFLPGKRILGFPEFKHADIIHAHNLHSLFFNLRTLPPLSQRKPFIWTLHDMWPFLGDDAYSYECNHWMTGGCSCTPPRTLPKLRWNNTRHLWKLKKSIYSRARLHLVTPSRWLAENVRKSMLAGHPCTVIYNGIDTDTFIPGNKKAQRDSLGLPQDKTIILFTSKGGKDNARKGWSYVEQIMKRYRSRNDLIFLCLGGVEGSSREGQVWSIPFISDPRKLAAHYSAADLLIYPSFADNCPLVVLEALASGLPVLSFRTGGIPELIQHKEQGYIAAYKNADDFSHGFEWILSLTPNQRDVLSDSCRSRAVEKFSFNRMLDEYLKLYYQTIDIRG